MRRKQELLLIELENKKLDIYIKQEQLENQRLESAALKAKIDDVQTLRRYAHFQSLDLEKARANARNKQKTIDQLLDHERELMFSFPMRTWRWFRNFRNRFKNWFEKQKPPDVASIHGVQKMSPEVAKMSADEYKKKFIDPEVAKLSRGN